MKNYAIYFLLGPGSKEIGRTRESLDALICYEKEKCAALSIWLINDGNQDAGQLLSYEDSFNGIYILNNPLHGVSDNVFERHVAGVLLALEKISRCKQFRFAIKLDTDALVIDSFLERVDTFFQANTQVGVIGSYLRFPNGRQRPGLEKWAPIVERAFRRNGFSWLRNDLALYGFEKLRLLLSRYMKRKKIIKSALLHGYSYGHHVQGGAYAVSGALLRKLETAGLLVDHGLFTNSRLGEDVCVSLLSYSQKFELKDFNEPLQPFGVWYRDIELPAATLVERRYAIIHSTKSSDSQDEAELREYFARRRKAACG